MYHGDMTEKLKLLYKLHMPPGTDTRTHTAKHYGLTELPAGGTVIIKAVCLFTLLSAM